MRFSLLWLEKNIALTKKTQEKHMTQTPIKGKMGRNSVKYIEDIENIKRGKGIIAIPLDKRPLSISF